MSLIYLILLTFVVWNLLQYTERNIDKIRLWYMRRKFQKRMDECKCDICKSQNRHWELEDLKPTKTKDF